MISEQRGDLSGDGTLSLNHTDSSATQTKPREVRVGQATDPRPDQSNLERMLSTNPRGYAAAKRDLAAFETLVRKTGTAEFCKRIGLVRRQVNRMISGAQPNPVNRLLVTIEAGEPEVARQTIEYLCRELGGRFEPDATPPARGPHH